MLLPATGLPPAVTIHGAGDARVAQQAGLPVTLLSAPGAALFAGPGWWRALREEVGGTAPWLLDCADAPGVALAALRIGIGGLILADIGPAYAAVCAVARGRSAIVLPQRPLSLDLAQPGAAYRLAAWLQRDIEPPLR